MLVTLSLIAFLQGLQIAYPGHKLRCSGFAMHTLQIVDGELTRIYKFVYIKADSHNFVKPMWFIFPLAQDTTVDPQLLADAYEFARNRMHHVEATANDYPFAFSISCFREVYEIAKLQPNSEMFHCEKLIPKLHFVVTEQDEETDMFEALRKMVISRENKNLCYLGKTCVMGAEFSGEPTDVAKDYIRTLYRRNKYCHLEYGIYYIRDDNLPCYKSFHQRTYDNENGPVLHIHESDYGDHVGSDYPTLESALQLQKGTLMTRSDHVHSVRKITHVSFRVYIHR